MSHPAPTSPSASTSTSTSTQTPQRRRDNSQFVVVALLVVLAIVVLMNTASLRTDFAKLDPIGPRVFPQIVAGGLLVLAALLSVAILRGSAPEAEEGEDIDIDQPPDWRTVALLVAAFVGLILTVNVLGWTISSGLFFAACAAVLGSRTWVRDLLIGAALGLVSFYAFYSGLGVPLPAGILEGIL